MKIEVASDSTKLDICQGNRDQKNSIPGKGLSTCEKKVFELSVIAAGKLGGNRITPFNNLLIVYNNYYEH